MIRQSVIVLLAVTSPVAIHAQAGNTSKAQRRAVVAHSAPIIERQGLRFKDLNRNGVLDPYEDWRLSASARARDLVGRMTLEEKAGMMMHGTARSSGPMGVAGIGAAYDTAAVGKLIRDVGVNSFITRLSGDPRSLAAQHNTLQEVAERTRLGIPLTISTDPRNHFQYTVGASVQAGGFSKWPETLGFAATRDAALVRRFADIARREYRAVGIHETLSPQADLATEPRWSRIAGTFGEDADLTRDLVKAYVEGFQHGASGVDSAGVLAVVKHWVGYGAQKNGLDSHSAYGKYASIAGSLDMHIKPFLGAFAAHVGGVMPTYSILEGATVNGQPLEQVGAGYNRQLLTDLLRKRYGFQGIILTDWLITNDCAELCRNGVPAGQRPSFAEVAMPWGVEDLPKVDRFAKAVNAGVDQFGGSEYARARFPRVKSTNPLIASRSRNSDRACSRIRTSTPRKQDASSAIHSSRPRLPRPSAGRWCCWKIKKEFCRASLAASGSSSTASIRRRHHATGLRSSRIYRKRSSPSSAPTRRSRLCIRITCSAR